MPLTMERRVRRMVHRGELTVYLGAASGVGKTYAMLQAAQERKKDGFDVVIGWLEDTHQETLALAKGMQFIEPIQTGQGHTTQEMNVDDILLRHPQLVVIDNLAHPNALGAPRSRRYLDVDAILAEGIDVYTTLNIHEIESYCDIIVKVTGMTVKTTVPDKFLEYVNRIQLVDVPPDEIMRRLDARNVSGHTNQAESEKFYRRGDLIALREMALRYTAQRVDRQLEEYMRANEIVGPWPVSEKVMVCVSASPFSAQLIRFTRQMASNLKVDWLAVYVETPRKFPRGEKEQSLLEDNLRLAEELGAEIVSITGSNVADELVLLARKRSVKEIVIGRPRHSRMWESLHGSVVDQVIRNSHGISVHVIPGNPDAQHGVAFATKDTVGEPPHWWSYAMVTAFVSILTILLHPLRASVELVNIVLLFLIPVVLIAVVWGLGQSFYAAILGLISFDWFFVPPLYSFSVSDVRYLISFAVFLTVATLTASLASRLRQQLHSAKQREAVTSALYTLSRQITAVGDLNTMLMMVVRQISQTVGTEVVIFLPDAEGELQLSTHSDQQSGWGHSQSETTIARWVYRNREMAGRGTETLRESPDLYIPLRTEDQVHGVLAVNLGRADSLGTSERVRMIEALARLAAVAIARMKLTEEAKVAHLMAESEKLRSALLDSISHELRTPLATIIGAVTGLLDGGDVFSAEDRGELLTTIREGAMRMNRLVTNLLGMVRLESGMLQLRKELCDIEDMVGVALGQIKDSLQNRMVKVVFDDRPPQVPVDDVLIEQVLVNVLSNAIKYSPNESEIVISVRCDKDYVAIAISDQGIGIPKHEAKRIFDKFHRSQRTMHIPGTGLGLAICKGVVEAHGGRIIAEPRYEKGTTVTIFLPVLDGHRQFADDRNKQKDGVQFVAARGEDSCDR